MRNRILVKVMEGIMSEGWFMVNIKKIIGGLGFYNNCYKIKRFDIISVPFSLRRKQFGFKSGFDTF